MKKDLSSPVTVQPGSNMSPDADLPIAMLPVDALRSGRWIDAFCSRALAEMMTGTMREGRDGEDRDPADCRCAEPRVRAGGDVRADVPCRCRTDDRYLMAA